MRLTKEHQDDRRKDIVGRLASKSSPLRGSHISARGLLSSIDPCRLSIDGGVKHLYTLVHYLCPKFEFESLSEIARENDPMREYKRLGGGLCLLNDNPISYRASVMTRHISPINQVIADNYQWNLGWRTSQR